MYERWSTYDSETTRSIDQNGNTMYHTKFSNGIEEWFDSNFKLFSRKSPNGTQEWFDSKGNRIRKKFPSGLEIWSEYNDNGVLIHEKSSNGEEYWFDSDGRITCRKYSGGLKEVYEYDKDGNCKTVFASTTSKNENMKNSKEQLETKIEELEKQLKVFKEELQNTKPKTIQEANPGDVLEDGSIVIKKADGLALVVAPKCTEVKCNWSKEFTDVFESLTSHGFTVSQWFVPTVEQLKLAYSVIPKDFGGEMNSYWSSENYSNDFDFAYYVRLGSYTSYYQADIPSYICHVRAFRCISY